MVHQNWIFSASRTGKRKRKLLELHRIFNLVPYSPALYDLTMLLRQDHREGEVEGTKGPGPVNILCHKILLLLYISEVHFYGNSSGLKGYLQQPSTLMKVLMSETQLSY